MALKYGNALRGITLQQIMSVIQGEKDFHWAPAAIKAVETVQNHTFEIHASRDTSEKKLKDWIYVETLEASDKKEASKIRLMKRNPKYTYGVIIDYTNEDGTTGIKIHYIHDEKDKNLATLSMKMKIVETFLEFKGFETSEEVTSYVEKKEEEADAYYRFINRLRFEDLPDSNFMS